MKCVWCVVQLTYYDEDALISVHADEHNAVVEAERLDRERLKAASPGYPRSGPFRVIFKEVVPP